MGFLRSIGKLVFSILFILSFSAVLVLYPVRSMLNFDSLKILAIQLASPNLNFTEEQKDLLILYLSSSCQNKNYITIEFGGNLTIDCSKVKNLNKENLESFLVETYLSQIYFKKYDCNFIQCFSENKTTYFLSYDFYQFIQKAFVYSLILCVFSGIGYFLLLKSWKERTLGFGSTFILIGIPYLYFDNIISLLRINVPKEIIPLIKQNFNFLNYFFWIGLILLAIYTFLAAKDLYSKKKRK